MNILSLCLGEKGHSFMPAVGAKFISFVDRRELGFENNVEFFCCTQVAGFRCGVKGPPPVNDFPLDCVTRSS